MGASLKDSKNRVCFSSCGRSYLRLGVEDRDIVDADLIDGIKEQVSRL